MTLRIERVYAQGRTVVRLIGRVQSKCLAEIDAQIEGSESRLALDLEEVTLVDVEAVRFLGACEQRGIELLHCAPYIRHWMESERGTRQKRESTPMTNNPNELTVENSTSSSLPDIGHVTTSQIGGLEIRLARSGRSDGIPILLTSPWPESIYAFRGILPAIKGLGPLILVDLPGFGRSESRPDVMSPEAMGDFVIKLADHLGVGRLHAVAPDVGTSALLFAAARKPTLFESVVVGDGVTSPELAGAGLKELIESPAGAFASAEGGDIGAGFVTQSAAIKTPAVVLEDYRLSSAGRRFEEAAQYVRAYPRDLPRLKALLPSIETPVLVLAGRNDPIVPPPNGQLLADLLPHCRHTLLEGGHLIWEDAAEAYSAHLAQWVQKGYRSV
jgi:pimeloyl-ACP methyl ester carboxylesterase